MIETKRLFLREMTMEDCEALYRVLGDRVNMQYYPHELEEAETVAWIGRNLRRYETLGFGLWAVCLRDTGEMIGDCGLTLQMINGEMLPEIGYHIRRELHRQGYAGEAARAVRDWAFAHTPFRTIYSYMNSKNLASQRTAMSYGCKKVGEFTDDRYGDMTIYALTREEYECSRENSCKF